MPAPALSSPAPTQRPPSASSSASEDNPASLQSQNPSNDTPSPWAAAMPAPVYAPPGGHKDFEANTSGPDRAASTADASERDGSMDFAKLPDDVFIDLANYLDATDLCNLCLVCRPLLGIRNIQYIKLFPALQTVWFKEADLGRMAGSFPAAFAHKVTKLRLLAEDFDVDVEPPSVPLQSYADLAAAERDENIPWLATVLATCLTRFPNVDAIEIVDSITQRYGDTDYIVPLSSWSLSYVAVAFSTASRQLRTLELIDERNNMAESVKRPVPTPIPVAALDVMQGIQELKLCFPEDHKDSNEAKYRRLKDIVDSAPNVQTLYLVRGARSQAHSDISGGFNYLMKHARLPQLVELHLSDVQFNPGAFDSILFRHKRKALDRVIFHNCRPTGRDRDNLTGWWSQRQRFAGLSEGYPQFI